MWCGLNKKNIFFLQVFFYICLWIVEVFHGLTLALIFGDPSFKRQTFVYLKKV
jgi:hypothetical protein